MRRIPTPAWLLACGAMLTGCTVETTPDQGSSEGESESVLQTFDVRLPGDTTEETVIPAIIAAGHDEIAAACESTSSASIRIFNPLASGAYRDTPCSAILDRTGEANSTLTSDSSDGPIGEAQQRFSPIGLGCHVFIAGAALFASAAICSHARPHRREKRCDLGTGTSFAVLSVMCAFI